MWTKEDTQFPWLPALDPPPLDWRVTPPVTSAGALTTTVPAKAPMMRPIAKRAAMFAKAFTFLLPLWPRGLKGLVER
jgi:hypothetical protein